MDISKSIFEFLRFLKQPQFNYKNDQPETFGMLFILYGFVFLTVFFVAIPVMALAGVDDMGHAITDVLKEYPIWMFFLFTVLMAPILEEFIFRFPLRYPLVGLVFLVLFILGVLGIANNTYYFLSWLHFGILSFLILIIALITCLRFQLEYLRLVWVNYFPFFFYSFLALFALAHIFNFSDVEHWYLAPVLVLPQAILSLFLGYVRVRNNIWQSIFFHAFHNLIPSLMVLLVPVSEFQ